MVNFDMRYKHSSFYGFYPSEIFDFGNAKNEICNAEGKIKSVSDLLKLKELYRKAMPRSLDSVSIIKKCEYSNEILRISLNDIENFSDNSQRTASELVSLLSLFASVMALGAAIFGIDVLRGVPVMFGVVAIAGACISYIGAVNLRNNNSALIERYRNMLMCFETIKNMAVEDTQT